MTNLQRNAFPTGLWSKISLHFLFHCSTHLTLPAHYRLWRQQSTGIDINVLESPHII